MNWELEREIWSHALRAVFGMGKPGSALAAHECGLCLTVPMFNFAQVQQATEQVVFEELRFASFFSAPAPLFSLRRMAALHPTLPAAQVRRAERRPDPSTWAPHSLCICLGGGGALERARWPFAHAQAGAGVVVDAGFSFMHAVPFFDWQPIMQVRAGAALMLWGGRREDGALRPCCSR